METVQIRCIIQRFQPTTALTKLIVSNISVMFSIQPIKLETNLSTVHPKHCAVIKICHQIKYFQFPDYHSQFQLQEKEKEKNPHLQIHSGVPWNNSFVHIFVRRAADAAQQAPLISTSPPSCILNEPSVSLILIRNLYRVVLNVDRNIENSI